MKSDGISFGNNPNRKTVHSKINPFIGDKRHPSAYNDSLPVTWTVSMLHAYAVCHQNVCLISLEF